MTYPYGRDIDSHCRTKCPKSRRLSCHGRITRVISRDDEGTTSIFWDATAPSSCDHPKILEDKRIVDNAVADVVKHMEPMLKLLQAIHKEKSPAKKEELMREMSKLSLEHRIRSS